MDDIGRFVSVPKKFHAQFRAIQLLAKNIPNTLDETGIPSRGRRVRPGAAKG
jgi:hypothetical protein